MSDYTFPEKGQIILLCEGAVGLSVKPTLDLTLPFFNLGQGLGDESLSHVEHVRVGHEHLGMMQAREPHLCQIATGAHVHQAQERKKVRKSARP